MTVFHHLFYQRATHITLSQNIHLATDGPGTPPTHEVGRTKNIEDTHGRSPPGAVEHQQNNNIPARRHPTKEPHIKRFNGTSAGQSEHPQGFHHIPEKNPPRHIYGRHLYREGRCMPARQRAAHKTRDPDRTSPCTRKDPGGVRARKFPETHRGNMPPSSRPGKETGETAGHAGRDVPGLPTPYEDREKRSPDRPC